MKRKLLIISLLFVAIFFVGCSTSLIEKLSPTLTNYEIVGVYDDTTKTLSCTQKTNYVNKSENTMSELYFQLYPNAFREEAKNKPVSLLNELKAYPNGKSYGNIEIFSVFDKNGELEYLVGGDDQNVLIVNFKDELYPDDRTEISIEYKVTLPNINHRFGYGENTINFGNFYPVACEMENGEFVINPYSYNGDPFYSGVANYKIELSYDKKFVIANTGTAETKINETTKTSTMQAKCVRDFIFVLSDKFEVLTDKVGNTQIEYFYYKDSNPTESLKTSKLAVETFNSLVGDYPYEKLAVVEANFVHGGMEYPNLVLISDNLQNYETYTNVIVHEIGHQWFYGLVGNDQFRAGWIDEGLTEYITALFYEINTDYTLKFDNIIKSATNNYCVFEKVYKDVYGTIDTSMTRTLSEYGTEPEYVYVAYVKSMLMFDSLRNIIGYDNFVRGMRLLYKDYSFKEIRKEHLIACFEKASGKELEGFFNSWINGKVIILN